MKSKDGWNAFLYAAVNGYLNTTEYLADECELEVNIVDSMNRSALHWAARFNNPQMVTLLLNLKVDEKLLDVDKMTSKDLAKAHSCSEAIESFELYAIHNKVNKGTF